MHQPGSSICLSTNPTIKRRQQIDRQLALKVTKGSLREGYFCRHSFAFIVITVLRVFPEDEASNLLVQLLYRTVCPDCCLFLVTSSCVTEKEWAKKLRLTLGTGDTQFGCPQPTGGKEPTVSLRQETRIFIYFIFQGALFQHVEVDKVRVER